MRRTHFRVLLVLIATVAIGSSGLGDIPFDKFSSNAPLDGEVFVFVNTCSGRCMSIRGETITQGALSTEATTLERWKTVRVGDYFTIVNVKTGKFLTLPGSSKDEGTVLMATDAGKDPAENQQWEFVKAGNHYAIKSRASGGSGLVVAVAESSKEDGFRVLQWTWGKIPDQIWMVQWVPGAGKK